jgi:hypothetical protein
MKRDCSARGLTDRQAASGFRGAVLAFRMRSSPDTFFVAAGWSLLFFKTKS